MTIGYVVKRYPRFSETFIVNEVLAHERAGLDVQIFSIRPSNDTHFQDRIARVRAPLTQLESGRPKASQFWESLKSSARHFPGLWETVSTEEFADVVTIRQAVSLAELVRSRGIRHLHAHFATLPAAVARLAAQIAGITYSMTAHAKDIFHDSVEEGDLRAKVGDAAAVVTVSEFNVAHLSERFPTLSDRLHRVYNGLDLEQLPFADASRRQRIILGVGRLVEKKGLDDLIRSCAQLRKRSVEFSCRIVGGGDQESQLRELIASESLEGVVELTGPIPQCQLKELIQNASVVAAPCVVGRDGDRDGLPTVILEAMALGTPCVATPVTGIPEVIRHDQTGLIVPERAPDELSHALERLLNDDSTRSKLARSAREVIDNQFDSRVTSKQLRAIFDGCSPHSAPTPPRHQSEQLLGQS